MIARTLTGSSWESSAVDCISQDGADACPVWLQTDACPCNRYRVSHLTQWMYSCVCMCRKKEAGTAGFCSTWPYMELYGVKSCDPPLCWPLSPPAWATSGSVYCTTCSCLTRDEPGWNTPRRFVCSQIHSQLMSDNLCEHCHLYLTSIIFLWNTPQIFFLLIIDCYYLFRLINHNKGFCLGCVANTPFWSWADAGPVWLWADESSDPFF